MLERRRSRIYLDNEGALRADACRPWPSLSDPHDDIEIAEWFRLC
jgi:hypothetical protein